MREAIPVDPHVVQGLKPLTPTFRMLSPQEGFEPISPASTPRYGGMPINIDNLAELPEAIGMIYNPAVGLGRSLGISPVIAMRDGAPRPQFSPGKQSHHSSQETISYAPQSAEPRVPIDVVINYYL